MNDPLVVGELYFVSSEPEAMWIECYCCSFVCEVEQIIKYDPILFLGYHKCEKCKNSSILQKWFYKDKILFSLRSPWIYEKFDHIK